MSLESWKAEFYPIPADRVKRKDALAHSLKKWIGLRPRNLEKHGLVAVSKSQRIEAPRGAWEAGSSFSISDQTCALCTHYLHPSGSCCAKCPLYKVRGAACEQRTENAPQRLPPYQQWWHNNNPEPMIRLLRKAARKP